MRRSIGLSLSALLLVTPAVTGCGFFGSDSKEQDKPAASSSAPANATESSDGGAADAPQGGEKPSKQSVVEGLSKQLADSGIPQAQADKTATCMVDKFYDKMSPDSLEAVKDSQAPKSPSDVQLYSKAASECTKENLEGLKSNLPSVPGA